MKRLISYLLVLVASLALIGHAVIPHHHHSSLCTHNEISDHQHEACSALLGEHDHSHDAQGTDCALGDTRVILTKPLKSAKTPVFSIDPVNSFFYAVITRMQEDADRFATSVLTSEPHYSIKPPEVLPGIGLRAPPAA